MLIWSAHRQGSCTEHEADDRLCSTRAGQGALLWLERFWTGGPAVDIENRRLIEEERAIELGHHLARALVVGPGDDAIRMLEANNRSAFALSRRNSVGN
jgi:hypothetical protein